MDLLVLLQNDAYIIKDAERYYLEPDGFWRIRKNGSNICVNADFVRMIGVHKDITEGMPDE